MRKAIEKAIIGALKTVLFSILKFIYNVVLTYSYWICLFCALYCMILYLCGIKKYGKYVTCSIVIYFVLQATKLYLQ